MSGPRLFHLPDGSAVPLAAPKPGEAKTFRAVLASVHDGDTFHASVHLGFRGLVVDDPPPRMRFAGGNAWESGTPGGLDATANLIRRLPVGLGFWIRIVSETADPHGRPLVTVALDDGTDLVEELIGQQRLARWNGHGVPPVPPWPRTVP